MSLANRLFNLASGSGIGTLPGVFDLYQLFVRFTSGSIDVEIDGQRLRCPVTSNGQLLYHSHGYKEPVISFFNHWIDDGDFVVDCGAGIGYYTIQAAKRVGPDGIVIAFEPTPDRYLGLLTNLRLNRWQNSVAYPVALADNDGKLEIEEGESIAVDDRANSIVVPCHRLDSLLPISPDLIKLDIEGAELSALRGMVNLLGETTDVICETHVRLLEAAGYSVREFEQAVRDNGYEIYEIVEPRSVRHRTEIPTDRNRTYLFSTKAPENRSGVSVLRE